MPVSFADVLALTSSSCHLKSVATVIGEEGDMVTKSACVELSFYCA